MSTVKHIFKSPVVYATDRSKAMVPVLFLFCVALWFILRARDVLKSSRALCPHVSSLFSILITSLGEEGAGLCASHAFVCLFVMYVIFFFFFFFFFCCCFFFSCFSFS